MTILWRFLIISYISVYFVVSLLIFALFGMGTREAFSQYFGLFSILYIRLHTSLSSIWCCISSVRNSAQNSSEPDLCPMTSSIIYTWSRLRIKCRPILWCIVFEEVFYITFSAPFNFSSFSIGSSFGNQLPDCITVLWILKGLVSHLILQFCWILYVL